VYRPPSGRGFGAGERVVVGAAGAPGVELEVFEPTAICAVDDVVAAVDAFRFPIFPTATTAVRSARAHIPMMRGDGRRGARGDMPR
jgi:hypothetical protein